MIRTLTKHLDAVLGSRPPAEVSSRELDPIYARRFSGTDRDRFDRLWCQVAYIARRSPLELNEDTRLDALGSSWKTSADVLEDICDLMLEESEGTPPRKLTTVGEVMDWLLGTPLIRDSGGS